MNNVLCIDLGSTNLKLHINNGEKDYFVMHPSGRDIAIEQFKEYVNYFLKNSNINKLNGIAVSFPGVAEDGKVLKSLVDILNNIGAQFLSELSDKIVYINDANAVVFYVANEKTEYNSICALTVGTNIGFAMINNGKLFKGSNKNAGEHRYYTLLPNGEFCQLNHLCSGRSIQKLLDNGVPLKDSLEQTAKYLVCLITQVYNMYDSDVVYLSGGAFKFDGFFELVETYLKPLSSCKIKLAQNPVYAGCLGAKYYWNTYYNK